MQTRQSGRFRGLRARSSTVWIVGWMALVALPAAVAAPPSPAGDNLADRVTRLELLVGPDERPSPVMPTLSDRMKNLEVAIRNATGTIKPQARDWDEGLRKLEASLNQTNQQLLKLSKRVDQLEREGSRSGSSGDLAEVNKDLASLRRDIQQIQRDVRELKSRK